MSYLASTRRFSVTLGVLLLLGVIWGCGGGMNSPSLDSSDTWPEHGYSQGVRSGSYVVVAVDSTERLIDPLTSQLQLTVEPTAGGERVTVRGVSLPARDRLYLHLGYDASQRQPRQTQCGPNLAERTVFLGITSAPGLVSLGLTGRELREVITGDCILAEVDFVRGALEPRRRVQAVADSVVNDLVFNAGAPEELVWTYVSTGDYNQDSEVGISDITPIGQYYKATPSSTNWQAARVADGDTNTEVNISDLTPIGSHYRMRVTGYQVGAGASALGPFGLVDTVAFTQDNPALPLGGGFKQYHYTLAAPVDNAWYVVTAANEAEIAAEHSNAVQYHGAVNNLAPTALTAGNAGDHIQLNWLAPAGGTPDGYNAYVANDAAMADGLQLINLGLISATNYSCPVAVDPNAVHYFGVKAYYATGESSYSNIYNYNPAGDTAPPAWADAQHTGIKSTLAGDAAVTVEWYTATDESPPLTYLVYYAEDASFDWATATMVEAADTDANKIVSGLTNGVTYRFGVRARDSIGNTDTNTNTLTATPMAGGVPVDTGVWPVSELVDDGGAVGNQDVGWFSDIAVKDDGTIGIAHRNQSAGDLLYTEKTSGGSWTTTTVSSEGQTGIWPSIAFNPTTGYPCIAYHIEDEAKLNYAEFDGANWNISRVDNGTDVGAFASLAFDPADDNPAIAYFDAVNLDVRYAKWDGTKWTTKVAYNGTAGGQGITGSFCSLAFDPTSDDPAIAFNKTYDSGGFPMSAAWITTYNGTSWEAEAAIYGPSNEIVDTAGWATSLCFSPSGTAYIITCELLGEVLINDNGAGGWDPFQVNSVGNCGMLAGGAVERIYTDIEWVDGDIRWVYYDKDGGAIHFGSGYGGSMSIEGGGAGGFPALAGLPGGELFASYLSNTGSELRFAYSDDDGTSWTPETAAAGGGGSAVVGERASLAFDPTSATPLISYYDASNGALKFSDKNGGFWRNEFVSDVDNDGSASQCGVDSNGTVYIGFFTVSTSYAALKIATGTFDNWAIDTIVEANLIEASDVQGNYCALGMNYAPNEAPGLAYHNTTSRKLQFAQGDTGGGFEETTVYEFNDPGRWNAVAFNPANKFAGVATYVRDNQDLYFVERAGNGSWNPVPVDTAGSVGNHCSLMYGATTARPWISYYDESNRRLKVAYVQEGGNWATGTDWKQVVIPAPNGSTDYGSWSSIAWHPVHNRAAVVFYDAAAGKLWYVFIGDPDAPQAAVEITDGAHVEGTHCSLKFDPDTKQPAVAYHDVTNGDLRYVKRN